MKPNNFSVWGIFLLILYIAESYLLYGAFWNRGGSYIRAEDIFVILVIVFFLFNLIVFGIFLLTTRSRKKLFFEQLLCFLLLSIIMLIPAHSSRIQYEEDIRDGIIIEISDKQRGNTLIPFYKGRGNQTERQIQKWRKEFTEYYLRNGYKKFRSSRGNDICSKVYNSFVTEDLRYIILTCDVFNEKIVSHYIDLKPYLESDLEPIFSVDYQSKRKTADTLNISGVKPDDFSAIYHNPYDKRIYGVYHDQLFLIDNTKSTVEQTKTQAIIKERTPMINEQVMQLQSLQSELLPNNRLVNLSLYLLEKRKCNQVDNAYFFYEDDLIVQCDSIHYIFFKNSQFVDNPNLLFMENFEINSHLIKFTPYISHSSPHQVFDNLPHSFITKDMRYIIATVYGNAKGEIVSYVVDIKPYLESDLEFLFSDKFEFEKKIIKGLNLSGVKSDDFSAIYHDPHDNRIYGVYHDQLFLIDNTKSTLEQTQTQDIIKYTMPKISQQIIQLQNSQSELLPNNRLINLSHYLLQKGVCYYKQVNNAYFIDKNNVIVQCGSDKYIFFKNSQFVDNPNLLLMANFDANSHLMKFTPSIPGDSPQSFFTKDMHYLIVTSDYFGKKLESYAFDIKGYFESHSESFSDEFVRTPINELTISGVKPDDFSAIYHDPHNHRIYGVYHDQLFLIDNTKSAFEQTKTQAIIKERTPMINEQVMQLQSLQSELLPNNRLVNLSLYLLEKEKCKQVDNMYLIAQKNVVVLCDSNNYFLFKNSQFIDYPNLLLMASFDANKKLITSIPTFRKENDFTAQEIFWLCNLNNQIDWNEVDSEHVRQLRQQKNITPEMVEKTRNKENSIIPYIQFSAPEKLNPDRNVMSINLIDLARGKQTDCIINVSDGVYQMAMEKGLLE